MLKLRDVTFKYGRSEKAIFNCLNFSIKEKEITSLVGPSGIGKTTLVNIIAGYLPVSSGEVIVRGQQVNRPGKNRIVINQENDLFPWMTVYENLKIVLKDDSKIEKLLQRVDLHDCYDKYPYALSGGMKKRLSFARAMAIDTDFIIMDEPFSSQDVKTKKKLHEDLLKIAKQEGKTVLLITHDIEEAIFLSDRILILGGEPVRVAEDCDNSKVEVDKGKAFSAIKDKLESLGY